MPSPPTPTYIQPLKTVVESDEQLGSSGKPAEATEVPQTLNSEQQNMTFLHGVTKANIIEKTSGVCKPPENY